MIPAPRRSPAVVLAALAAVLVVGGCAGGPASSAASAAGPASSSSSPSAAQDVAQDGASGSPSSPSSSTTPPPPPPDPAVLADTAAGVLARDVPQVGTGQFAVVPGSTPATGSGDLMTVRVEVEGGLPADGAAFADFAMGVLADPRGWGREGWAFARTDGPADVVLTLASPDTSAALCAPLQTMGTLSCRNGDRVVLTWYRWVNGTEDYGSDLTGYRQYVVSHEVGHRLGHGHEECPGPGQVAPTMMQQTKGVLPCLPNPWPHP